MKITASDEFLTAVSSGNNEPEWLRAYRIKSLSKFFALPYEQEELFKKYVERENEFYTDGKDYVYELPMNKKVGAVPNADNLSFITSGFAYSKYQEEQGITIRDIIPAAKRIPEFRNLIVSHPTDKLQAFNDAVFNAGVVVCLNQNKILKEPVRLISFLDKDKSVLSTKNVIIAEDGSELHVVEEIYSSPGVSGFFGENLEVHIGRDAKVNVTIIQNLGSGIVASLNRDIDTRGAVTVSSIELGGSAIRYRLNSRLVEPNATSDMYEAFFGDKTQRLDSLSRLIHVSRATQSRFFSRGVLRDSSSSSLKGVIKIEKEAKNSYAYLSEHSLTLSKKAKSNAVPSLEIKTDDVKATHSASSQPIDTDKLFYLMSRGLTPAEAEREISIGYIDQVMAHIPSQSLKSHILKMIGHKWDRVDASPLPAEIDDYLADSVLKETVFAGHYKYKTT